MTFTRARHNPLSLVILNERHFCASEGPRRAARTGVPHHARLWRDGVGDASRSLRGNTRAFGTLPYDPRARVRVPPGPHRPDTRDRHGGQSGTGIVLLILCNLTLGRGVPILSL